MYMYYIQYTHMDWFPSLLGPKQAPDLLRRDSVQGTPTKAKDCYVSPNGGSLAAKDTQENLGEKNMHAHSSC